MDQMIAGNPAQIIDVDMQNFMDVVMTGSQTAPVIVQFWAPWCGPCKQLGPVLEKVIADFPQAILAKINIDTNQEIAAQLRVQSVPTVYGFAGGRPVDGFAGAQPESAVRAFIEKIVQMAPGRPDISAMLEAGATALSEQDYVTALGVYQQALGELPDSMDALAGLAKSLVGLGELEQAAEFLEALEPEKRDQPQMREVLAALELAQKMASTATENASELGDLEAQLAADPDNLQHYQDLAMACFAASERVRAMDVLLQSIAKDASWNEGAAKAQLLEFFSAIGHGDPDVVKARRKLSSTLFS